MLIGIRLEILTLMTLLGKTTEDTITTKSHLNSFLSGKDPWYLPKPGD